jgi:hypothetical protein
MAGQGRTSHIYAGTSILNPTLSAGSQYWVEVSNSMNRLFFDGFGVYADDSGAPSYLVEANTGSGWTTYTSTPAFFAFEVDSLDSTPEPAAGVLLGAGLLALVAMRKRLAARRA